MSGDPLTSSERSSMYLFAFLLLPIVLLGVGIIPVAFIIIGIKLTHKHKDFSYITIFFKYYKGFMILVSLSLLVIGATESINHKQPWSFIISSLYAVIPIVYIVLLNKLLYQPMLANQKWVENNSII